MGQCSGQADIILRIADTALSLQAAALQHASKLLDLPLEPNTLNAVVDALLRAVTGRRHRHVRPPKAVRRVARVDRNRLLLLVWNPARGVQLEPAQHHVGAH